jgi:hypothetical protein
MCSAHAWADPGRWPAITEQQREAETRRIRAAGTPKPADRQAVPDPSRLGHFLRKLSNGIRSKSNEPRQWANDLRDRHQGGERLTKAQIDAYQAVANDGQS